MSTDDTIDEELVQALTYRVMDYSCDLADRQPSDAVWEELEETVRDVLRFLPAAREEVAAEKVCPVCEDDNWALSGACAFCGAPSKVDTEDVVVVPSGLWTELPNGVTVWQETGQDVEATALWSCAVLPACGGEWRVGR